jgi:hypothetical protein
MSVRSEIIMDDAANMDVVTDVEAACKKKKPLEDHPCFICCHLIAGLLACLTFSLFVIIVGGLILLPVVLWILECV